MPWAAMAFAVEPKDAAFTAMDRFTPVTLAMLKSPSASRSGRIAACWPWSSAVERSVRSVMDFHLLRWVPASPAACAVRGRVRVGRGRLGLRDADALHRDGVGHRAERHRVEGQGLVGARDVGEVGEAQRLTLRQQLSVLTLELHDGEFLLHVDHLLSG